MSAIVIPSGARTGSAGASEATGALVDGAAT